MKEPGTGSHEDLDLTCTSNIPGRVYRRDAKVWRSSWLFLLQPHSFFFFFSPLAWVHGRLGGPMGETHTCTFLQ